jgi:hypothetical protein
VSYEKGVIEEVLRSRLLTVQDEEALSRVKHFVTRHDFASHRHPRLAAELLAAGVVAAAIVTVILTLTRHVPLSPTPAGPTSPVVSSQATSTPSPVVAITSTVVASPPLILYWIGTTDQSYQLAARTYSGQSAGSLVIPYDGNGYEIAPNGSRVLDGERIISANGSLIGRVVWTVGTPPIWADDSAHLCGVTYDLSAAGRSTLVEFDPSGHQRTVADLGTVSSQTSWQVLACSPSSDRAVVVKQGNNIAETIEVVGLSTGALLSSHQVADATSGASTPVASHDGSIIAVNESSGIAVRNGVTWALLARIVRWGSQAGFPLIGSALMTSWDGSRLLIDGGGASGASHPMWFVDWRDDRNVLTSAVSPSVFEGAYGGIVPSVQGAAFFIAGGVTGNTLYLLHNNGKLQKLAG